MTKTDLAPLATAAEAIAGVAKAPILPAPRGAAPVDLILDRPEADAPFVASGADHGAVYKSWSTRGGAVDLRQLKTLLADPPPGLFRFKGRVRRADGGAVEAHLVGRVWETAPCDDVAETRAVAIGFAAEFDVDAFDARWRALAEGAKAEA